MKMLIYKDENGPHLHHSNSWVDLWRQGNMDLVFVSVNTEKSIEKALLVIKMPHKSIGKNNT